VVKVDDVDVDVDVNGCNGTSACGEAEDVWSVRAGPVRNQLGPIPSSRLVRQSVSQQSVSQSQ
jgi:hypothetical protein